MAATKRQMNWAPVIFTPTSGTADTATGVTQCSIDHGKSILKFSGDGDHFPTTVVEDFRDPSISVTCADQAWIDTVALAGKGVIAATHKDALAAVGGNITYSLSNAIADSSSDQGSHKAFGSGQVKFSGQSADGVTSPLAISLA
jgi:hypothetical protein